MNEVVGARPRSADVGPVQLAIRIAFAIVALVPVAFFVDTVTTSAANGESSTAQERLGLQYVRVLNPLTDALVAAESAAVAGRPTSTSVLTEAIAAVDEVDARIGASVGLQDRWATLRARISPPPSLADKAAAYQTFVESTDLLLALYGRLQHTALLTGDPQSDIATLQAAALVDLPRITVAIGRYADLAVLNQSPTSPTLLAQQLSQLQAAIDAGSDLVGNVESAVATTASQTLSGDIFTELNALRARLDVPAARPAADPPTAAAAASLRGELNAAATALSAKLVTALDGLIATRADQAHGDRVQARLLFVGAIAIAVLAILYTGFEWWRSRRRRGLEPELLTDDQPSFARTLERSGAAR